MFIVKRDKYPMTQNDAIASSTDTMRGSLHPPWTAASKGMVFAQHGKNKKDDKKKGNKDNDSSKKEK